MTTPALNEENNLLDWETLVARMLDDEDLALSLLEEFLAEAPRQMKELEGLVEAGDVAAAERRAHTLKGMSANIAADALAEAARQAETAGRERDLPEMVRRLPAVKTEFERVQAYVRSRHAR
jgi:HPt (histidine-containing phosphotransfer) domain-containing protein